MTQRQSETAPKSGRVGEVEWEESNGGAFVRLTLPKGHVVALYRSEVPAVLAALRACVGEERETVGWRVRLPPQISVSGMPLYLGNTRTEPEHVTHVRAAAPLYPSIAEAKAALAEANAHWQKHARLVRVTRRRKGEPGR